MWSSTLTPGVDTIFKWGFTNHNGIPGQDDSRCFSTLAEFQIWTAHPDSQHTCTGASQPPLVDLIYTCPDQRTIPEEPNGIYANPQWNLVHIPGITSVDNPPVPNETNGAYIMIPSANSPAIDAAMRIPGINDNYAGSGPDIGAFEVGLDTQAPSIPGGLQSLAISPSRIALTWNPSTDNTRVLGYVIYRNGNPISFTTMNYYLDYNLNAATNYNYQVSAYDINGLESGRSNSVSSTTFSNSLPVLNPIGSQTVYEGFSLIITLSGSDLDIDNVLTYSATNLPSGAVFNSTTKTFSWIPGYTQSGVYTVHFQVDDGQGGIDFEDVAINVIDLNPVNLKVVKLQYGQPVPALGILNYTGAKDSWLAASTANIGYYERGASTVVDYRNTAGGTGADVGFYWFNLSAIPSTAQIVSAKLQLYSVANTFDSPGTIPIYLVQTLPPNQNVNWVEGIGTSTFSQNGGTSWNAKTNISGIKPLYTWSSNLGRYSVVGDLSSAYSGAAIGSIFFAKANGEYNSTDLSSAIQSVINNGYKYEGLSVDMGVGATSGVRKDNIATKEYSNVTSRPALFIYYTS